MTAAAAGGAGGGGGGRLVPLGAWVAGLTWDAIPELARRAARVQLANLTAAVHSAARCGEAIEVTRGLPFGAGPSTVIATGERLPPAGAAFVNAACSMAQDYDDILWMGHTGHSAVFAALAVAEAEGASVRELLTAIVAANELGGRLGASSFLGPLNGQMWTFIHLIGAAAATARLLRLDAARTTHALAIALSQPPFALQPAFFGPTSKLIAAATPTQIGIQAAYLARAGMTGATDVLEDPRGFWRRFAFRALPEMLDGLGALWVSSTLTIKTAPCCHFFQTACESAEALIGGKPLDPAEVKRVVVATTKLGDEVTRYARQYGGAHNPVLTPIGVGFDLGLAVAVVLTAGRLSGAEADHRWLEANAARVRAWYDKIVVEHDVALTARVVASGRAIPAGRRALAAMGVAEWLAVVRQYRAHYRSSLLRREELSGWLRLASQRRGRGGGKSKGKGDAPASPVEAAAEAVGGDVAVAGAVDPAGAVPLYFPNRVTIERVDGGKDAHRVDLPSGSLAARGHEAVLRRKFLREVAPRLGEARAEAALAAALAAGEGGEGGEGGALAALVGALAAG